MRHPLFSSRSFAARTTSAGCAFDDTPHLVAPSVVAMHDGTAAIVDVTETGTPRGGTARDGEFTELQIGWWLEVGADGVSGFQTFAAASGFPQGSGNVTAAREDLAAYAGAAAGVYATVDSSGGRITNARSGESTAEATLRADFFGTQDAGAVTGEIGSFRDEAGRSLEGWRVILNAAPLTAGEAAFAGEAEGMVGTGTSGERSWKGRFHGTGGAATRPSHVAGRFDLHFPGAHFAGAVGAEKR